MKTCPTCHEILPDEAMFCPVDGTSLSSVTSDPLLGSVISERYLLKERIGQGSSGIIYRAEHTTLGKPLALKLIHDHLSKDPEVVSRFEEESAFLAKLKSEHIVKYSDLGKTADGRFFMVMEFFEGETLSSVLSSDGKLEEERSVKILEQVGETLGEAHGLGFVHRDIRPRNILLVKSEGGQEFVKLLDFGLSRLVEPRKGKSTQQGSSVGDPRYMSPEQASGGVMDQRSDIYSLAILAYEMVTGNPPFVGAGTFDILAKHREAQPVAIRDKVSEISKHFADAVNQALSKKPKERYPTVIRFINAMTGKAPVALSKETAIRSAISPAPTKKVSEKAKRKVIEEARRKATAEAKRRAEEARKKRAAAEAKKREAEEAAARLSVASKAVKEVNDALPPVAKEKKPKEQAPPLPLEEPEAGGVLEAVEEAPPPPGMSRPIEPEKPPMERPPIEPLLTPPPIPPEALPDEQPEAEGQRQGHYPPGDPSESGVWFAEGLAAEQSLASQSKSGPLPAIYDDLVEEEQSRKAIMPIIIIGGVVGIAALVLFIFIYVLGGDKETNKISKAMAAAPLLMDQGLVDPPAPASPAKEPESDAGTAPSGEDPAEAGAPGEENPAGDEKPAAAVAAGDEPKPEPEPEPKPEPPPVAKPEPKPEPKPAPVVAKPAPKPKPVVAKKPAPKPRPVAKPPRTAPPKPRPRPVAAKPKKSAGDAAAHVKAGRAALSKGSYSMATTEFKKAVAISSRNAEAHAGMGEVAFELGDYGKAEKALRKAVRYNPRKASYQVLLGHVVFKLGKYKTAVDYYKKALKLSPGNAAAKRGLAAANKRLQ